ncbi:metal-dependent phosphohydrolase, partial [Streptomyces violarus]|nr:metal-dependent phosphohydrolase [Streptomyces violarus]
MEAVSTRARVYVACVTVAALFCLLPLPGIRTPWWAVALLAALYAGCERAARSRFVGISHPAGTFYPVLLAGAFLLPAPAAALVAVPGALLSHVGQRPVALRR